MLLRSLDDGRAVLAALGATVALPPGAQAQPAALQRAGGSADVRAEDFAALAAPQTADGTAQLDAQLSRRWAALALRGEDTAPQLLARTADSRRASAAALMGRADLAAEQAARVLLPQAEVRACFGAARLLRGHADTRHRCRSAFWRRCCLFRTPRSASLRWTTRSRRPKLALPMTARATSCCSPRHCACCASSTWRSQGCV
jgi:hypothetical protein